MTKSLYKIGIDVGGTFTDLVMYQTYQNKVFEEKILTTSTNPHIGILNGLNNIIQSNNISFNKNDIIDIVHGTTLFTNSLISRTENPPALFVTKGAEDIIYTGKGNRYDPYDRLLKKPEVLVPKNLRFAINERILIDGSVYKKIDDEEILKFTKNISKLNIESVAVVLLHSYKNNKHEKIIKKIIKKYNNKIHISLSSEICPEIGEFDRINTTCSNAYIQPIAENYLRKLDIKLKKIHENINLKLIWSDGGVSSLRDSISNPIRLLESGPAGGSLAISYLSKKDKTKNAIAFDMGGTTAKISLISNNYPHKSSFFEFGRIHRNKPGSGIKIKVPSIHMLEIGAGGGSIAKIDNLGLIKIGPKSAGSNPGPISYDLNGVEPTVTDVNLLLGYLSSDIKLAGYLNLNYKKTKQIIEQIAKNNKYSFENFIKGVRKIVNENMCQAIKLHVTELGDDPRNNVLYAFGGAGPLHAYDICEKLGINNFIVPNRAGILSSYGFLTSKIGLEKNYSFLKKLNKTNPHDLKKFVDNCIDKTFQLIKYTDLPKENFKINVYYDMRYSGQGFDLSIKNNESYDINKIQSDFTKKYIKIYGLKLNYEIQISSIKIELNQIIKNSIIDKNKKKNDNNNKNAIRKVWFEKEDKWVNCKIINYNSINNEEVKNGPVIIESDNTTIVIGKNGNYVKKINGDIHVVITYPDIKKEYVEYENPINLELILARIRSIADEADRIILKTAFSSAVRDGKDYSLVISDKNGRCVGMPTECMPLFITCMPRTIKIIANEFKDRLYDGDIIITNDPWIASGHKSDVALISPVFIKKELFGFIGTILHVADIGGSIGDFRAWDFFEEGLMISPVKFYNKNKLNLELLKIIEKNVRLPKLVLGDIFAMVSTITAIKKNINSLNEKSSGLNFEKIADEYSKRMISAFRKELVKFPKGVYRSELYADGILLEKDINKSKNIYLKVKINLTNEKIIVDFRGSDKQRERQPINVPYSYTMSDTFYAIQYILFGNVPNIGTQYCPIEIIVEDKSILNAKMPVPVYARTRTGIHISSLINLALSKDISSNVIAGCGHNVIFRASGFDSENKYFAMTFMPKGGMGATGQNDGFDCTVYPTNCTMIQTEIAESRAPILIERNLAPNTSGKGKYRGGSGQYVKITSLSDTPLQFSFRPNFMKNNPKGLNGGEDGGAASIKINGIKQKTDPIVINKHEYVEVVTAGGGGIGSYIERDKSQKEKDFINNIYI